MPDHPVDEPSPAPHHTASHVAGGATGTTDAPSRLRRRREVVTALQLLVLVAVLLHIYVVNYVADDGFISFRYADHLAQGNGVVYNVGERVEGYTNFLWVILLAGVKWAVPSVDLLQVARVVGSAASVLTLILAFRLATLVSAGPAVGLLAGAFLAANSSLVAWAPAGLETSVFTLCVFAAAVSFAADLEAGTYRALTPLLLGLSALTRPDGVLFFGATLAAIVVRERPRPFSLSGLRRPVLVSLRFAAIFLAIYIPHAVWRYAYYGDIVPNTAYAKVGVGVSQLGRGVRYLWRYVAQYGVLAWMLPVGVYLWRSREGWLWYFVWLIALYVSYVIYVGGDGLAFHRFIAHIAPLMYFVAAAALVDVYRRYVVPHAQRGVSLAVATLSVASLLALSAKTTLIPVFLGERARWFEPQSGLSFPGNGRDHAYVWFDNYFVDRLAVAGRYLEQNAPPNSLVASTPAGSVAYHMHHRVIDMLGLTDKHIARTQNTVEDGRLYGRAGHEKGDGDYVLSRAPDYILMGNVAVFPYPLDEQSMATKLVLKSEHELWASPEFHRRYELVCVRLANAGLFQYFSFFRKRS